LIFFAWGGPSCEGDGVDDVDNDDDAEDDDPVLAVPGFTVIVDRIELQLSPKIDARG
jgi:hypothetical protein